MSDMALEVDGMQAGQTVESVWKWGELYTAGNSKKTERTWAVGACPHIIICMRSLGKEGM